VHVNAAVPALRYGRDGWSVRTCTGERGPYRHVILNTPARNGRELLRHLRVFARVASLLDAYEYFDSRLLVHTDPVHVQSDRANWAAYNAGIDGRDCEGSVWLGRFTRGCHPAEPSMCSSRGPSGGVTIRSTSCSSDGSSTR
jgi:uncharacterized protein